MPIREEEKDQWRGGGTEEKRAGKGFNHELKSNSMHV